MKVYYSASSSFSQSGKGETFTKTVNYLSFKVGKKNLRVNKYTPPIGHHVDPGIAVKLIRNNEKALKECDVFIADMTDSSAGLGFEVALAMVDKKPVLILRNKNDNRAMNPILDTPSKTTTYREYETIEDITKHIDKFLDHAKDQIDTKFLMIVPAALDRYITWAANYYRMHKAQVVRKAVEAMMAKDKNWKNYRNQPTDSD